MKKVISTVVSIVLFLALCWGLGIGQHRQEEALPQTGSAKVYASVVLPQPIVVMHTTTTTTPAVEETTTTTSVPVKVTTTTVAAVVEEATPVEAAPSLEEAFAQAVPAVWRDALPMYIDIIPGSTSWSDPRHGIHVSERHANRSYGELLFTIAHEFGHQISYIFGDVWNYGGAPPVGWPGNASGDQETWADCVGQAFTGHRFGNRCTSADLAFTQDWLSVGPYGHAITYPGATLG